VLSNTAQCYTEFSRKFHKLWEIKIFRNDFSANTRYYAPYIQLDAAGPTDTNVHTYTTYIETYNKGYFSANTGAHVHTATNAHIHNAHKTLTTNKYTIADTYAYIHLTIAHTHTINAHAYTRTHIHTTHT